MYLSIFLVLCVATLAYRLAEADNRKGWFWGLIAVAVTTACSLVISSPIYSALAGLVAMLILMTLANIWLPAPKGAGLRREKK